MGFEFGYSVADPLTLVLWEGQFGDFANGAQIIIDQFIVSAESKWNQPSGLVLLLPHGFEGQGPEHSSARMERFLQLCAENNMQVCNCTTPAQYFHLAAAPDVRRRGPARHTQAADGIHAQGAAALSEGSLAAGGPDDGFVPAGDQRRAISGPAGEARCCLCSGKVYYDLVNKREELRRNDVAILRIEQLYPFPLQQLQDVLRRYSDDGRTVLGAGRAGEHGCVVLRRGGMQPIINPGGTGAPLRRNAAVRRTSTRGESGRGRT